MWQYTDEALQHIGDLFVEELKKRIKQKSYPYGNPDVKGEGSKYASGDLYNSISANVIQTRDGATLEISYNDYFKYVNKGRKKGRGLVPIKAILKWISIKGIKGRSKKGRFIKNLSFAFAIQKNIFKYGIRPTNIYDNTLDTLEETFNNLPNNLPPYLMEAYRELYEAIGQDVNLFIEATLEKELNTL